MDHHRQPDPVNAASRCACGKLIIPSVKAARKAIRETAAKGHTMYWYRCEATGDIHLTSRPTWDTRRDDPRHIRPPRGDTKGL
jgi:hypothetical protein